MSDVAVDLTNLAPAALLQTLRDHAGDLNSTEIGERTGMTSVQVCRRLHELEEPCPSAAAAWIVAAMVAVLLFGAGMAIGRWL